MVLALLSAVTVAWVAGVTACRGQDKRSAPVAEVAASGHALPPSLPPSNDSYVETPVASAAAALERILGLVPTARVVAFGEVHAPRDAHVASATARFRQELLPLLAPRTSAIVVEAWQPAGCNAKVEAKIAQTNREVTQQQAKTNPNEYLALATDAKARGLVPFPLRPTCDESARVADAGAADVGVMLDTVTRVAQRTLEGALERSPDKLVLFYGGALHNDVSPSAERASWSFGPALTERTNGGFVEVDLVVPEFIKDTEVWRSLPWRNRYDVTLDADQVQLLARDSRSFVIVFAKTK